MARTKGSVAPRDKQRAPLVVIAESTVKSELSRYQRHRKTFSLETRLNELLWSPEGWRFDTPLTVIRVPDSAGNLIERSVDERFWFQRQMTRQRDFGDGHMKDRAILQKEALAECENKVRKPYQKLLQRATRKVDENAVGEKFDKQKHLCEEKWLRMKEQVCAIGEQFWDQNWLYQHTKAIRDNIRNKYLPEVLDCAQLPPAFLRHHEFVLDHLGHACEAEAQEYVAAVTQVVKLWSEVKHLLDFSQVLPEPPAKGDSPYTAMSGNKNRSKENCARALRRLRVPDAAIEKLLVAWSLAPFPTPPG